MLADKAMRSRSLKSVRKHVVQVTKYYHCYYPPWSVQYVKILSIDPRVLDLLLRKLNT